MIEIDNQKIIDSIKKTGFVIEYEITKIFKGNKWSVISNKYYLDDVEGVAREIDLIAYRSTKKEGINIYTALIVSCKKSEENFWSFLVRDLEHEDPNIDLYPIKSWSNDKICNFITNSDKWREKYIDKLKKSKIFNKLIEPDDHLFAFQELRKSTYSVQNDKNIFNSISSLMKAQDYELSSLERRKKVPSIYFFYLASVVDTSLIKIHFKDGDIAVNNIEHTKYLINYIVDKKETQSKIHFIDYNFFANVVPNYNLLHQCNIKFIEDSIQNFYKNTLSDSRKINLLLEEFTKLLYQEIYFSYRKVLNKTLDMDRELYFVYDDEENLLRILFADNDKDADLLNGNGTIMSRTSEVLKTIYRYDGNFKYFGEIPF
jgi:hypothetical protein